MPPRFWLLAILCACIPDADVIAFAFGIPYGAVFGHRGFSHSLAFALLLALLVVSWEYRQIRPLTQRWLGLLVFFFLVTASHGVLDAMTDGGLGIAFFSPFDTTRYFLPWRPLSVPPIGVHGFFSSWGLRVMHDELLWIWLPCALLVAGTWLARRSFR